MLCAKFGLYRPKASWEKYFLNLSMYFRNFVMISPWKYEMVLHLNKLEFPSPRMRCAKFGLNWPSGFGEEDDNVKSLRQRRKRQRLITDKFWSEKLTWAFSSGELKIYNMNFSYISKTPYCWVYNQSALKRIPIFSNLLDFQRVGTTIIHEWTDVAVLCCHGKRSSYIHTSKETRSRSYGQISFKPFWCFSI